MYMTEAPRVLHFSAFIIIVVERVSLFLDLVYIRSETKLLRYAFTKLHIIHRLYVYTLVFEPQHHRASKVWRGLSQEFGVVRLYRTFSSYSSAGETRCAGCLCTSSGWFKHIEPHRTYSNHNITKLARCVGHLR